MVKASGKFDKINGIDIIHGRIVDNPFAVPYIRTQATQWMLQNSDLMKSLFKKQMGDLHLGESVEDCFTCGLDYFLTDNKVFNRNYFGRGADYTLGRYVINSVPSIVRIYRRSLSNKLGDYSLVTDKDKEDFGFRMKVSERDLLTDNGALSDVDLTDSDYFDNLFLETVMHFKRFAYDKNYLAFNVDMFIYLMFIDIKSDNILGQKENVARELNIPKELLTVILTDLSDEKSTDSVRTIYKNVLELLRAYREGQFLYNKE